MPKPKPVLEGGRSRKEAERRRTAGDVEERGLREAEEAGDHRPERPQHVHVDEQMHRLHVREVREQQRETRRANRLGTAQEQVRHAQRTQPQQPEHCHVDRDAHCTGAGSEKHVHVRTIARQTIHNNGSSTLVQDIPAVSFFAGFSWFHLSCTSSGSK